MGCGRQAPLPMGFSGKNAGVSRHSCCLQSHCPYPYECSPLQKKITRHISGNSEGNECQYLYPALFPEDSAAIFYQNSQHTISFTLCHVHSGLKGKLPGMSSIVSYCHFILSFFFFFFYFILLYNTVLVLPYIDMNPPRVYMSLHSYTVILLTMEAMLWQTKFTGCPKRQRLHVENF